MNVFARFTARAMAKNSGRTLVTILGVILSAAMFTAVTTFAVSLWTFLVESAVSTEGDYFVCCHWLTEEEVATLEKNEKITTLARYNALGYLKTQDDADGPLSTFVVASADAPYFDTMPIRLSQGTLPKNSKEILLHEAILSELAYYSIETEIGKEISLDLLRQCSAFPQIQGSDQMLQPYSASYTIVGYIAPDVTLNYELDMYPLLTLSDGQEGFPLWTRAYIKTAPRQVWDLVQGEEFHDIEINDSLLALYGQSRYENFTSIIFWLSAVLCLIIVIGSVSLIYNSFSISLSERTKQFGLLSCIGATKKQLRRAVYAEALFLAAPGIPLGVLFGYGGISLTLFFLRDRLSLVLGGFTQYTTLRGVFSPLALLLGALLALGTLFLSAALPAKRATAISPLEAIRQNRDYQVPKRRRKSLGPSLFGLPGALAKNYYRVSKGKYRATLISLIISLVLFLSASGFTTGLKVAADQAVSAENYDFDCSISQAEGAILAQEDFIDQAAYAVQGYYLSQIRPDQRSAEFLKYETELGKAYPQATAPVANIQVYYLEDDVLRSYLRSQNIDPTDYLDPHNPKALVCYKEVTTYMMADENGIYTRYTYHYPPFSANASELVLFPDGAPSELNPFGSEAMQTYGYSVDDEGNLILSLIPLGENQYGHIAEIPANAISYLVQWEGSPEGAVAVYYLIDATTGLAEQTPIHRQSVDLHRIPLGETIRELPFGISYSAKDQPYYTSLILPLSAVPAEIRDEGSLCFTASDYDVARAYLESRSGTFYYSDYRQSEEAARAMILVVDIFSYGFIVLICLICIANIFNTLSTNVTLRKKDFGMLRSIGFCGKDLDKMLCYECLTYGGKALLWGLPIGLLANGGIQKLTADLGTIAYVFPTKAAVSAVVSVFIIVFTTMFYAASKLRKDNPVEAIRQECI